MIENNCNMTKFLKGLPFRKNNKNLKLNKNILSVEKYIIKSQQNKKNYNDKTYFGNSSQKLPLQ